MRATNSPHPTSPLTALCQGAIAITLLLFAGSTFSLGIFIPTVEALATPTHHLDGTWETAMGAMHLLSAPIMIVASIFLDAGHSQHHSHRHTHRFATKTVRLRVLHLLCVVAFALFAVSAHGAASSNRFTLFFGVLMQAFPLGILYLTCVQTLMAWFPNHSGMAVGLGNAAFGVGTVVLTQLFSVIITNTSPRVAILLASIILSGGAFVPSLLMRWPSAHEVAQYEERDALLQQFDAVQKMPWYHIIRLANFWLYIIAVLTTSATYMLNPYYFKLGHLFHRPLGELVLYFNLGNLAATLMGLLSTAVTDVAAFGSGFWFSGAKNVMMLLMLLQTICLYASIFVNSALNFVGFVIIKAMLKIIVSCHTGSSALLARDLFGSENSVLVFGVGAGLALGLGEAFSAWIMAGVEAAVGIVSAPSDFNAFYYIAVVWSIVGLISLAACRRHKSTPIDAVI